jgi:hypothetical protein
MMIVGIICIIALMFVQQSLMSWVSVHVTTALQQRGEPPMPSSLITIPRVFAILIPGAIAVVLAWITYKLSTPSIQAEFDARAA